MSEVKAGLGYTVEHEWVEVRGSSLVRIGITDYAQRQLGDIVFVEVAKVGTTLQANETVGTIESVKTVSDFFSPVSGTVTRVNDQLLDASEKVNDDPYGHGWIVEIEIDSDAAEAVSLLLNAVNYAELIGTKSA
nr:glycine cleavage system protein GcvH [Paenibacillus xylanexedens]